MDKILDILSSNFISLLIGTLLGAEIMRFLYRPHVIIQFKNLMPLYSDNGYFLSIKVANRGRTAASNCIGNITLKYILDDLISPNAFNLDKFEDSLPRYRLEDIELEYPRHQLITPHKQREIKNSTLCWSELGNPLKMDINPGASQNLDICRIQKYIDLETNDVFWYLIFPCEQGWRKVRARIKIKPNTTISGKLFICPNNVFPTVRKFIFELKDNNDFPTFKIERFNLLKRFYFKFNRSKLYFD